MSWKELWTSVRYNLAMMIVDCGTLVFAIAFGMISGYRIEHGKQTWTGFATGIVFGAMISFLGHVMGRLLLTESKSIRSFYRR